MDKQSGQRRDKRSGQRSGRDEGEGGGEGSAFGRFIAFPFFSCVAVLLLVGGGLVVAFAHTQAGVDAATARAWYALGATGVLAGLGAACAAALAKCSPRRFAAVAIGG